MIFAGAGRARHERLSQIAICCEVQLFFHYGIYFSRVNAGASTEGGTSAREDNIHSNPDAVIEACWGG